MDVYTPQERIKLIDAIEDRLAAFIYQERQVLFSEVIARRIVQRRYPGIDTSKWNTYAFQSTAVTIAATMHCSDMDTLLELARYDLPDEVKA